MTETERERPGGDYAPETLHGTTAADHEHVSPDEAEQARNVGDVGEGLPEPDERFDVD